MRSVDVPAGGEKNYISAQRSSESESAVQAVGLGPFNSGCAGTKTLRLILKQSTQPPDQEVF